MTRGNRWATGHLLVQFVDWHSDGGPIGPTARPGYLFDLRGTSGGPAKTYEDQRRRAAEWARSPSNPANLNSPLHPANPRNLNNPANPLSPYLYREPLPREQNKLVKPI